jgi:hypothetical protein
MHIHALLCILAWTGTAGARFSVQCHWDGDEALDRSTTMFTASSASLAVVTAFHAEPRDWHTLEANRRETARANGGAYCQYAGTVDGSRSAGWNKLLFVLHALNVLRFDRVLWLDTDAYVAHPSRPLAAVTANASCALSGDIGESAADGINTGVFLLSHGAWTTSFLTRAWTEGPAHILPGHGDWDDQNGIRWVVHSAPPGEFATAPAVGTRCTVLPYGQFQLFPHLSAPDHPALPGAWIHHYAGFAPTRDFQDKVGTTARALATWIRSNRTGNPATST